jgi:hypothetical protein
MRASLLLFSIALACASPVHAEYFGAFSSIGPKGQFQSSPDRPIFVLSEEFWFDDPVGQRWKVPKDATIDGASIPWQFWSLIGGPFEGDYLNASVVHDHYCIVKTNTAAATHKNFYFGMMAKNVPEWKAKAMYWAVSTFGPDWENKPVIRMRRTCSTIGSENVCTTSRTIVMEAVPKNSVDLSDPQVMALAISKFNAIARTLKTTDGQTLDVTAGGEINATVDSINANSDQIRQVFSTRAYIADPAVLGVMSDFKLHSLDELPKWENNVLPKMSTATPLGRKPVGDLLGNEGFKIEKNDLTGIGGRLELKPEKFSLPEIQQ